MRHETTRDAFLRARASVLHLRDVVKNSMVSFLLLQEGNPMGDGRWYMLFDSRAAADTGTDGAQVFEACESQDEARNVAADGTHGAVACYSYDASGEQLTGERWEWDWWPELGFSDGGPDT